MRVHCNLINDLKHFTACKSQLNPIDRIKMIYWKFVCGRYFFVCSLLKKCREI